jgi:hypothetical protein
MRHVISCGCRFTPIHLYRRKQADAGSSFQYGGPNTLVQRRLEVVLGAYEGGGFSDGSPELFRLLADAALLEVPMREIECAGRAYNMPLVPTAHTLAHGAAQRRW